MRRLQQFFFGILQASCEVVELLQMMFVYGIGVPFFVLGLIGLVLNAVVMYFVTLVTRPEWWHLYLGVVFCVGIWWRYFGSTPSPATPIRRGRIVGERNYGNVAPMQSARRKATSVSTMSKIRRGR